MSLLEYTKYAVQTCVLSKRWQNLWTQLPSLHLSSKTFCQESYNFQKFIDMVLSRRQHNLKLESFTFRWVFRKIIPRALLDQIHSYAQSHKVRHFSLRIGTVTDRVNFPHHKYNPKSPTSLHLNLSNWYFNSIPCHDDVCLLQHRDLITRTTLETLRLENFFIMNKKHPLDIFSRLVKLKDLCIICCEMVGKDNYLSICAPRLERLTVLDKVDGGRSVAGHWSRLRISSSGLKYLGIDLWTSDFTLRNQPLLEDLEINVHVYRRPTLYIDVRLVNNLINALKSLSNAKSVTLSNPALQVLSASPDILKSEPPCPQLEWKLLKVKTTSHFPTCFPEYHRGLAYLRSGCSETTTVDFV